MYSHEPYIGFSPLLLDLNVLKQRANGYLNEKYNCHLAREELDQLIKSLNGFQDGKLLISNDLYEFKSEAEYNLENPSEEEKKYNNFDMFILSMRKKVDEEFEKLYKPLTSNFWSVKRHNYLISSLYFKDSFFKPFDKKYYCEGDFYDSYENIYTKRTFKCAKGEFKYDKLTYAERSFHVVALPYKTKYSEGFTRYIVYLIPFDIVSEYRCLGNYWNFFHYFSKEDIKSTILGLKEQEINLSIPLMTKHRSMATDFEDIGKKLEDNHTCDFRIKTLLATIIDAREEQIDEKNEKIEYEKLEFDAKLPFVVAKGPYISFIYDMRLERIISLGTNL